MLAPLSIIRASSCLDRPQDRPYNSTVPFRTYPRREHGYSRLRESRIKRERFHERCVGPSGAWGVGGDRENRWVVARARRTIESRIRQRALAGRTTPFTVPGP